MTISKYAEMLMPSAIYVKFHETSYVSFLCLILIGYLSKWLLCSAVAIGETSLMMMTGSLKQAKHSA